MIISVYCPVYEVKVCGGSPMLEKMSVTSKFLIECIGDKKNLEKVEEVIQLGEEIFEQEINCLVESNLVKKERKKYKLTDVGQEYYELIKIIKRYADDGILCILNRYNECLYEEDGIKIYKAQELKEGAFTLENNLSDLLIGNDDFSNSLEILKDSIGKDILREEYSQDLYAQVQIVKKDNQFIRFDVDFENAVYTDEKEEGILFEIPYVKKTLKKCYVELDPFRDILPELEKVYTYEWHLLSENGENIIEQYYKEKAEKTVSYEINQFTKKIEKRKGVDCSYSKKEKRYSLERKMVTVNLNKWADRYRFEPIEELDVESVIVKRIAKECFVLEDNSWITLD